MDERTKRAGLNEAVFREVNERLRELGEGFGLREDLDLVCECGNAECTERISMPIDEYEALRSDPAQFAVVPGHAERDLAQIVARRNGYEIVRKRPGGPEAIAEATDPRSS